MKITIEQPDLVKSVNSLKDQVGLAVTELKVTNNILHTIADALVQIAQNTKPEPSPDHAEVILGQPQLPKGN